MSTPISYPKTNGHHRKHIHKRNNRQAQQVIFRSAYYIKNTYVHIKMMRNVSIFLKESKERDVEEFGGRKGKGTDVIVL